MKVSDSLVNVPNELSQLGTNRQTDRVSDQLLELLEWLFATKNGYKSTFPDLLFDFFRVSPLGWDIVDESLSHKSLFSWLEAITLPVLARISMLGNFFFLPPVKWWIITFQGGERRRDVRCLLSTRSQIESQIRVDSPLTA